MQRLSSLDAQFLAAEHKHFGSHYCGIAIFKTGSRKPITAATMRTRFAERIHLCPPLRWKVVTVPFDLDRPVFVDSDVNLDDHISETTLPAPADESALSDEVAAILATPLDRDKPLWRLRVFHGMRGHTVVVMTLHHAAMDGIAAGEIFANLLDGPSDHSADDSSHAEQTPNPLMLAARGLASAPLERIRSLRSAPAALAHLDQVPVVRSLPGANMLSQLIRGDLKTKRLDAPRTRFNAKLSSARSAAFGKLSLSDVKAIKNELGITVNDVVIAVCAGALRRRMTSTSDLPNDPLVAYIPVSTRLPEAPDRYGNAISSVIAPIPTHLSDPTERLTFAHDTLAHAKKRAQSAPPTLMSDVNDPIPAPLFGFAARGLMEVISSQFVRPPVNLVISNVPGMPTQMTWLGAPLLANYPMSVVFDGFTLNITVISYQDGLDVGIVGDAQTLPDAWELMDDMRDELAELSKLVGAEKSPKQ